MLTSEWLREDYANDLRFEESREKRKQLVDRAVERSIEKRLVELEDAFNLFPYKR